MQAMERAGLTPARILRATTRDAAEFLGALREEGGTIEAGKRADLVLLRANPLQTIANAAEIEAVSIGGRWLDRAQLDRMLERAKLRIGSQ
jgi:imidazolonepropionase-like amidohydrolase